MDLRDFVKLKEFKTKENKPFTFDLLSLSDKNRVFNLTLPTKFPAFVLNIEFYGGWNPADLYWTFKLS